MFDQTVARWHSLQSRERTALMAAFVVVAASVFFLAVVDPIITARAALRDEVQALAGDLDWMRDAAGRLGRADPSTQSSRRGDETVLSAVDSSAQRAGLRGAVRRLQPEGSDGVRITLDDASFDAAVLMLGDLRDRGVRIERLTLRRERRGEGLVDGSMSLRATD